MGRPCTVCNHDQRQEIDKALVTGTTHRSVAKRFGLAPSSVYRHKKSHLAQLLKRALEKGDSPRGQELIRHRDEQRAKEVDQALDVVQQLKAINAACLEVLSKARNDGKDSLSLKAVDRILRQIELQAKLIGELQETGPQVNVLVAPEWHEIRVNVLQALTPYPEARSAVAKVLTDAGG